MNKLKQVIIGLISEKGGTTKSSIMVGMIKRISKQSKIMVINMDESSYSAYHILKDAGLKNVGYADYDWNGLPKLLEAGIVKYPYVFIDFKGEQINQSQLDSINKWVNYFLVPIVPSKTNMGAFDHTLKMFNQLPKGKVYSIFSLLNNMKINNPIVTEFSKKIDAYTNVTCFENPLYTVKNIDDPGKTIVSLVKNKLVVDSMLKVFEIKS